MFSRKSTILFFVMSSVPSHSKVYNLINEPIDIVMPCHPKDLVTLDLCIEGIKKNVINHRRIIVVSEKQLTPHAEWVPESAYPFTKYAIAQEIFKNDTEATNYINNKANRAGWIFKQLTNLYHFRVIPGLSSNVLVIDCDTIFLNPVSFLDEHGNGLYNPGTEYYKTYFLHGEKVIPGFKKVFPQYSGISHHMLFQKDIMEDMLSIIETTAQKDAWRALCQAIDINEVFRSPIADYELYFNFAFMNTDQVKLRMLKWINTGEINTIKYKKLGYDFISCHHYMRQK